MALAIFLLFLFTSKTDGALQPPRRVGMQAFQIRNTLWIDGGHFLNEDASVAYEIESSLLSYNMSLSFQVPDGPIKTPHERDSEIPIVHHGFMFSNLIDRAWLFGGYPVGQNQTQIPNNIWRFEPFNSKSWTELPLQPNATKYRPYRGAGCNVSKLQRGYYLGGLTDNGDSPEYLHWLHEFNMDTEAVTSFPVPEHVPVVNQSLVFLDTGSRRGALVALGGSVEKNGTLSKAPLTSVFIFDIQSRKWMEQPVSGLSGDLDQDNSVSVGPPDGSIPASRVSACAVVGSAQDKTSHNIFFMGGTNETRAITNVWVLSLPSAIWIKAPLRDPFSTPKTENSCILTNDRFVMMFGGCFLNSDTKVPCMGYGHNPLSYDISRMAIEHYTWHHVGYLVNETISEIIGGDVKGNATKRTPRFTKYSDPVLEQLFVPPLSVPLNSTAHYKQILRYSVTFLVMPFGLTALYSLAALGFRMFVPSKFKKHRYWRPSVFSSEYLVFLNLITIFLIILVATLTRLSQLPDRISEHWYGAPDSDVIWTGTRWSSTFTVNPTSPIPRQGLVAFYKDKESGGIWSGRNSTQRAGASNIWTFTYLPMIVAVIYGRLWKVLDDEMKRLDVYIRLGCQFGDKAKDSLLINYHTFWVPLSIFSALRRGHWCVAISSFGNVMGSIVVPLVQNYMFEWELYSGGRLAWPDTYGWQVALINPKWAAAVISSLVCALLCSLALLIMVRRLETGLPENPQGLASVASMLPRGGLDPTIFPTSLQKEKLSKFLDAIGEERLQLQEIPGPPDLMQTLGPPSSQPPQTSAAQQQPAWLAAVNRTQTIQTMKRMTKPLLRTSSTVASRLEPQTQKLQEYLLDHPTSFALRPEVFISWVVLLTVLLILMSYSTHQILQNDEQRLNNFAIPFSPNIYLVLAIFIQSTSDVITYSILSLFPFYLLQSPDNVGHSAPPASALFTSSSYADLSGTPILSAVSLGLPDAFLAFSRNHTLPVFALLSSGSITVTTVFLGSLQLSSSFYGATSVRSDLRASMAATLLLAFVLGVNLGVYYKMIWCVEWEEIGLRRPVDTVGGVLSYLIWSDGLNEDLKAVEHLPDRRGRIEQLREKGRRYAFGKFKRASNGEEVAGIERVG